MTRLGPFFVYSFTAVFAIGLLLSWGITQQRSHKQALPHWLDAALATLIGGWLGARLTFVLLNWDYFAERPSELVQLWQGGLTAYGGLAGGLLGLGLWCWWRKRPFLPYATLFSPALLLLIITGWAACWIEGCAYGVETTLGLFSANLPDHFGVFTVRYQTQLLGVSLNLLLLLLVYLPTRKLTNLPLFPLTLISANLIHFALTFLRGDAAPVLLGWRLDSWLALLFALGGVVLLQYGRRYKHFPEIR
ncbi:prolipoprotein diacylglyceryl transferase family protein [Candidatus Leptofilum sp.]|uniref:prolipoprotein diacylglyceryl transferase family protein n=1 Tax=Candidatus Leptofilum sp. TaxID=3241576 RepID=UPI003B5AC547